ncbi:PilZ domain-containing protein [Altericroceibacterium endophyticum]|uniref:PilZ domain-containing protein n=1 Tax=Altericroceibacterium endophyticum TaxID=1808508 RepID=A0A6I4T142_9SPHN|nr:PilZ domain-containing protein [Altericroceibacterium endophyticum]MXO64677.1 PilZ domain-containing protein [Altericroceibacterium endophyticum]
MQDEFSDLYRYAAQEDRCAPRTVTAFQAQLRIAGRDTFSSHIHDVSLSGFRAMSAHRIASGSVCYLTIPDFDVMEAIVVWWKDGMCGCAFRNLLDRQTHDRIVSKYRAHRAIEQ